MTMRSLISQSQNVIVWLPVVFELQPGEVTAMTGRVDHLRNNNNHNNNNKEALHTSRTGASLSDSV